MILTNEFLSPRDSRRTVLASILMPAFNAHETIVKAIASVVAQTMEEWELWIIADDNADYESLARKAGFCDARIGFARTGKPRSGPSVALNIGRRLACGRVVMRLDADDWYEPERLAMLVPLALRHGAAGDNPIAYDDRRKRQIGSWIRTSRPIVELDPFNLMISPIPFGLTFRRDVLPQWDEDLTFAEDVLFNARAFEHATEVPIISKGLSHYRIHDASLSHSVAFSDVAETVYAKLIAECDTGHSRFRSPALQRIFREALLYKQSINQAFCLAHKSDPTLSFQEFVLDKLGQRCECESPFPSDYF